MNVPRLPLVSLASLLWLASPSAALAQSVPDPSIPAADKEEAVVLSPFEVRSDKDTGYRAASTLAGGRIETALDHTPAAVSVMTRDFLDDIGATNFNDAAKWGVNTFLVAPTSDFSDYRVDFRSTNQAGNGTVNYFIFSEQMDTYSTDRLEFSRGPNALLFGEGNLSGVWTVHLKRPQFRDFTTVQLRADTFSGNRATLDFNRQLWAGKAAIRIALLNQEAEYYKQPSRNDRQGAFMAGAVQLTDTLTFRFEAEYGERRRTWGDQPITDNVSAWNGTPYTGTGGTPAAANGWQPISNNADYWVYLPNHPETGLVNWRGFTRSTGNAALALVPGGRPEVPNSDILPRRDFDIQPPNNISVINYYFATAYLEKRFSDNLFVQLAWNRRYRDVSREGAVWGSGLRRDTNQFMPGGALNPNFGKLYVDGDPWIQRQWQDPRDFRLLVNYRFETSWTKQSLSLMTSYYRNQFHMTNTRLTHPNSAGVVGSGTLVNQRYYLDEETKAWEFNPLEFPSNSGVIKYRATHSTNSSNTFSTQIGEVGSYFNDKLTTIFGLRHDELDRFNLGYSFNSRTGELTRSRADLPDLAVNTPSAGLVFYPIRQIGAFVNYSESFSPLGAVAPLVDHDGAPESPMGSTWEYGIYFNALDQRLSGSIRYYDSVQTGRIVGAPGITAINNIWRELNKTLLPTSLSDTQNLDSTGYEFEVVANLTPSWRTTMNLALPTSKQSSSYPFMIAYRARHLAEWEAAAASSPAIRDNLATLQGNIESGSDGREQNSALKYSANIYTSYDFRRGALRGFSVGGGANIVGDQIIGNVIGQPFQYIYSPGYVSYAARLAYNGNWRGIGYRIQLNVDNVFDDDHLIFSNVGAYQGVNYPNGYRFLDPRRFSLTTTFNF